MGTCMSFAREESDAARGKKDKYAMACILVMPRRLEYIFFLIAVYRPGTQAMKQRLHHSRPHRK